MSREQVQYLLGTPTLQDVFHSDRWDYPYYYQPGTGKPEKRLFTVWFDGDFLERWRGDAQPDRQPHEQFDSGAFTPQPAEPFDEGYFPSPMETPDGELPSPEPLL